MNKINIEISTDLILERIEEIDKEFENNSTEKLEAIIKEISNIIEEETDNIVRLV